MKLFNLRVYNVKPMKYKILIILLLFTISPIQSAKAFNYDQFIQFMDEGPEKAKTNKHYLELMDVCKKDRGLCKINSQLLIFMEELYEGLGHYEEPGYMYFKKIFELCQTSSNYNCWSAAFYRLSASLVADPMPEKLPKLKTILSDIKELSEINKSCKLTSKNCRRTVSFYFSEKIHSSEEIIEVINLCDGHNYCMDVSLELPKKKRKNVILECKKKSEEPEELGECIEDILDEE